MTKRKITIIIGLVVFAGSIILFNILASGPAEEEQLISNNITAVGVPVIVANPSSINSKIHFTGRVIPKDRLELFAEVFGILENGTKSFKSGTKFYKDDVLMKIDDREQKQAVLNQKSQFQSLLAKTLADISLDYANEYDAWSNYLSEMDINNDLKSLPTSENRSFNLFINGRGINASYYAIKQNEVRLSKHTIIAPYDGVLTESTIDSGTLVRANQRVGEFIKTGSYEIEASINADERFFIRVGDIVQITIEGSNSQILSAKIDRINSKIDPTTQTLLTYLEIKGDNILSGQYVSGNIKGRSFDNAQKIASKSLVRNDKVFLSKNSIATIHPIKVLVTGSDSIIVQGLKLGDLIIDEFRDAAFEGTKVVPLKN